MTVRICNMTFSDWITLPFEGSWTDTFIFRIDARACLPPFEYAPLLERMAAQTLIKRPCASIWVQVDSPGEWYVAEVKRSLAGLKLPYGVTRVGDELNYLDFSVPPELLHSPSQHPPIVEEKLPSISQEEVRCLQALGRMRKGNELDIASLAGLSVDITQNILTSLEKKKLVVHKTSPKVKRDKSKPAQMDLFPLWHTKSRGLSLALRSWGVPKGTEFSARTEENLQQIGTEHRHIARAWPAWLRSAWSQAEIWTGWSEVQLPDTSVIPDGLAWGRIQEYETLFWLEVGDEHKSRKQIREITAKRLQQARTFCERTGVRLVYALLSTKWVHEAARWALANLPPEVAVVMGNQRRFGELPIIEWGKMTDN